MLYTAKVWILMGTITYEILAASGYEITSGICGMRKVAVPSSRIVGGTTATHGSWPWQVMMKSNGVHICGAVLISEKYMLTAAHCALSGKRDISYHLGAYRIDSTDASAVEVKAHTVICHEDYDPSTYAYDLCVIKLVEAAQFTNYIQPVCLPAETTTVDVDEEVTVTGWGATLGTGSNVYLNEAEVLVINTTLCRSWYDEGPFEFSIPQSHFCAGHAGGKIDTCVGDSGGPLVHEESTSSMNVTAYVLRGITSFGYDCAREKYPGVYVRVSYMTPWIEARIRDLSGQFCQAISSDDCGGIIASETTIRSPTAAGNYDYPSNQHCSWNVTAPAGFKIQFNFICYFLLSPPGESGEECQDFVEIESDSGNKQRFCGNEIQDPYLVDSETATFTFVTNQELNYPGFVVQISFIQSEATTTNSNSETVYMTTGNFDTSSSPMSSITNTSSDSSSSRLTTISTTSTTVLTYIPTTDSTTVATTLPDSVSSTGYASTLMPVYSTASTSSNANVTMSNPLHTNTTSKAFTPQTSSWISLTAMYVVMKIYF